MEQVSPREVLQVLEKRFRERLDKARIYPRLIHQVAPHLRRLRCMEKFLELGCMPYISDSAPPRGFLPFKGVKGLKALSIYGLYPFLHFFDGRIFLDMDATVYGKRLYIELGEALPTYLPIATNQNDGEKINMSCGELRRCLDDVRRYTGVLRKYIRADYPPALPREEFEAILCTSYLHNCMSVSWPHRDLFTPFLIFRTLTASELKAVKIREEERMEQQKRSWKWFESLPKRDRVSDENDCIYEVEVEALPRELFEKIIDVADKAYLSHSFHSLYRMTRLGISTPINYLLAAKILEKRGFTASLYRPRQKTSKTAPTLIMHLTILYDYFHVFIKPKPLEQLPKTKLAKPIITSKRLMLVEP